MATIVRYSATAGQTDFTIPFPYLEESDVYVALNGAVVSAPVTWDFLNASTVRFTTPLQAGDAVIVQRRTESDERLVDFQNGAVLTEEELDLAHLQNFYLIQEMRDALNDVASAAVVDVSADQLQEIGEQILSQQVADTIQQRVSDIDTAGELLIDALMQRRVLGEVNDDWTGFKLDTGTVYIKETGVTLEEQFNTFDDGITTLAQDISLLGARNGAGTAFILDVDTVLVSPTETMAQRFAALVAETDDAFAAIASEETARIAGDAANATSITTLTATVNGNSASITTLQSVTSSLEDGLAVVEANWGVALDVNGHITGVTLNNDGATGSFAILADEFYIVDPANGLGSPVTVFGVSGGVVSMQNAYVAGDLLVDGTITANFEFSGATIEIPTNGYIFSGSSTFMGAAGWWIGTSAGDPRLFFGNPSGDYISYANGVLTIDGDIRLPGAFVSSDTSGAEIVRNDTDGTGGSSGSANVWETIHEFSVYGTGTIAVRVSAHQNYTYTPASNGLVRVLKNNSTVVGTATQAGVSLSGSSAETAWTGITVDALTDTFQVQVMGGTSSNPSPPFDNAFDTVTLEWTSVRAVWQLGEFF